MLRALPLFLLLAACADFPEVGRAEAELARAGDTPALLTDSALAALVAGAPDRSDTLAAEASSLRDRARRLRNR